MANGGKPPEETAAKEITPNETDEEKADAQSKEDAPQHSVQEGSKQDEEELENSQEMLETEENEIQIYYDPDEIQHNREN